MSFSVAVGRGQRTGVIDWSFSFRMKVGICIMAASPNSCTHPVLEAVVTLQIKVSVVGVTAPPPKSSTSRTIQNQETSWVTSVCESKPTRILNQTWSRGVVPAGVEQRR